MQHPMPARSPEARRRALDVRARVALYAAAATVVFVLERLLPNPLPWVRLGLANAVTLVALLDLGAGPAAAVVVLRLLLGSFFAGTVFAPQFVLSASGAAASWGAMSLGAAVGARIWSPLGLSLLGSVAHAVTQLAAASRLLGGGDGLWQLLPLFLILAIATGVVTGLAADMLLRRLGAARAPAGP